MILNYVKTAVRNLIRQKSLTCISLFSLVVGTTCFILLTIHARFELSYDSFFAHSDRIFQLGQYLPDWKFGGSNHFTETSGIVAPTLKEEFSEVEYSVRTKELESPLIYGRKSMLGKGLYADRDFLKVFTFPLESGDGNTALQEPHSVVLSKTLARKLFGAEDPLGRFVFYEKGRMLKVTGVLRDIPGNTHLRFDYLISFLTMYSLRDDIDTSWGILNYNSYIQLRDGASVRDFTGKLPAIVDKYHDRNSKNRRYFLVPLRNIHFETHVANPGASVDKKNIYLLVSIAFLILLICCVNHVNLSTARADARGKEVGIRKTVGATRPQLRRQFLIESYILTFLALLLSVATAALVLPAFGRIAGNDIPVGSLRDWRVIAGLGGLFLAVGFLAGGYPALYLSRLKPLNVLKGGGGSRPVAGRKGFRYALTLFQLSVMIVLVVSTVFMQKQLRFIARKDIGYDRENVLIVRTWDDESRKNHRAIKSELLRNPQVVAAAVANTVPLEFTEVNDIQVETESGEMARLPMVTTYFIDADYVNALGMRIAAGRNFSEAFAGIDRQVLINETAARLAGLKDPVGKKVLKWGQDMMIIGVVKDFHYASLRSRIEPLLFTFRPEWNRVYLIKISGRRLRQTLEYIDSTFRRFSANFTFDHAFLDDLYAGLHETEGSLGRVILGFSLLALIIAAVGMYGLISFEVVRKTKEIAVRKVLGAPLLSIMAVVLRKFLALVAVAAMVSLPLAYYAVREWLQGFVYRIGLNAGSFLLPVSIIMLIAFLSVGRQTLKAALARPVESLKRE